MTNLITNPDLGDGTYYNLYDANVTFNRVNFNCPDGGNLFDFTVSGLTVGVRHKFQFFQEVAAGDSIEVLNISGPGGHGETGPVEIEFTPEYSTFQFQFRGHGSNGMGWIAVPYLTEIPVTNA